MSLNNPDPGPFGNTESEERPFFTAVLTPYRSLTPNGFLILMACLGAVSFGAGIMFWRIGAWPVFGFFGLDMALVWLAFRLNYASAKRFEEVRVSRSEIVIRKVGQGKNAQEYRFNPLWVRLSVDRIEDEGVVKVSLTSRGQTVDLGNFLNPEDRTSFAGAMANALAAAKTGF